MNPFTSTTPCDLIVPSLPHKLSLSTVSFLLTLSTLFPILITFERYFAMKNAEKYEKMRCFLGPILVGVNVTVNFGVCWNVFKDEVFMDGAVSFSVYPADAAQKMFTFFIVIFCINLLVLFFDFLLLRKNVQLKNQLKNSSLTTKYQLEEVYQSTKFSLFLIFIHIFSFGVYVAAVVFFRYFGTLIVEDSRNLFGIRTFSTTILPTFHFIIGIAAILIFNRIKSRKSETTTIQMSSTGNSGANNYDQAIFNIWNSVNTSQNTNVILM
ncbi:CBN-SRB-11 protein [Caenorhabditis brenneri]|uniref:CBN-SRB-11 protein n=1 Tax=Caenorhabditis brenneri TaxID=135651 RepID=G0N7I1_CAEBE|nr:CBN-SRB-11 protein [Caenorhabditis brenneri]